MIAGVYARTFGIALVFACGCGARVVTERATGGHGPAYSDAGQTGDVGQHVDASADGDAGSDGGRPRTGMDVALAADDATEPTDVSICDPFPGPPAIEQHGCFENGYCPPSDTQAARDQLAIALHLCDTNYSACCGQSVIDAIPCRPSTSGGCCYTVFTRINDCTGSDDGSDDGGPPGCLPNRQPCDQPSDCCSNQCNVHNYCGPILCRPEGSPCAVDEQCCELHCVPRGPFPLCWHCIHTGEPCSDAGVPCCESACDPTGHC